MTDRFFDLRSTTTATLLAVALFAAMPASADGAKSGDAVLLVLMPGTPAVHIIEMPDLSRCREAAEFTPSAKCVMAARKGRSLDPQALLDFVPASGPSDDGKASPRQVYPLPNITYKPLD